MSALCANDGATAHWLHGSTRLSALRLKAGRPGLLPSPEEAAITAYSKAEQTVIAEATASHVIGDPATVTGALARLANSTGVDELMVTTATFDHAARLASYELLARAAGRRPDPGEQRVASALAPVDPVQVPGQVRHPGGPLQTGDPAEGLR